MLALLPALSYAIIIAGIAHYASAWPAYWERSAFSDFCMWSFAILSFAYVLQRYVRHYAPHLLLTGVLVYLLLGVGLANGIAVAFFMLSSFLAGRSVLGLLFRSNPPEMLLDQSLIIGFALQLALFGTLIHFPVNTQALYFLILASPALLLLKPGVLQRYGPGLSRSSQACSAALARMPYWSLVISVLLLGQLARYAMFPTVGYDDNAQHLRMWTELTNDKRYWFDVVSQIGAVVPFAVDLLHSIVSLLAGADARGALNLGILLLLLRQVWILTGRLVTDPVDRLIILVLFGSTPILAHLLTSLQTELFLAFLAATGVKFSLEKTTNASCNAVAILALAAICCATKLPGAVLGLALLIAYCASLSGSFPGFKRQYGITFYAGLAAYLLLLVFVAFESYLVAFRITGNPVFPFYNGIFKSPFFPVKNFSDLRYIKDFSFSTYWDIFFKTSQYYESFDFVAGFQYLLLFPLALIVFVRRSTLRQALPFLVPIAVYGLAMFATTQYWRYLFPVLPLAGVVMASLVGTAASAGDRKPGYVVRGVFLCYTALNFYLMPGISWSFSIPLQKTFNATGRNSVTEELAPVKRLTEYLNQKASGMRVLYDYDTPYGATLSGKPVYVNWYSSARHERAIRWKNTDDISSFLKEENIDYVIWNPAPERLQEEQKQRNLMSRHLSIFGFPEHQIGSFILYRLFSHEIAYRRTFSLNQVSDSGVRTGLSTEKTGAINTGQEHHIATSEARIIASFKTDGASIARYNATFQCNAPTGHFIAQINWDVRPVYYKRVACEANEVKFTQAIPIPPGSRSGDIYLSAAGGAQATVSSIEIETN